MAGGSGTNLEADDSEKERQLEAVIADYIRSCETDVPLDRREILNACPELADELRQFFAQRDRMQQLAEPIREFADDLTQAVRPGQQIGYVGNYELLEEIARGGMGVVYKARQVTLGRIVAVKMIVAGRLASDDDVKRFQAEARTAAALQHPHIVSIHEVGQHDGWHYFSMDFVAGRDLSAILREKLLPAKQAAMYVRQMAEAIHYAHQQGTLHRDLKPSNVLIDDHDQVRITDFGLAMRVEGDSDLTRSGQIVGTPSYMPPEQAEGKRSLIGAASDVYSLGAVLYECLTGRPPFRAESVVETIQQVVHAEPPAPRLLNPAIPRDLETICLKCLEKEPHRRYGTAQLLADDLGQFLEGEPISARPISQPARVWRWCRRKPAIASLSAATALLLAGITLVSTLGYLREADLRRSADDLRIRAENGEDALGKAVNNLEQTIAQLRQKQEELEVEQRLTVQKNSAIADLEIKRRQLQRSIDEGERLLADNLIRLARSEWQSGDVVRADLNLEKCPEHLRGTEWRRLKRLWLPDVRKFSGYSRTAFSPDGAYLAIPAGPNLVELWEVATHRLVHTLAGHTGKVTAVSFNYDGTHLASGSQDRTVRIWSLPDGKLLRTLEAHSHPVSDVTFGPDGRRLATASLQRTGEQRSGEVIVWNAETFQEERRLPGYGRVAFGPEGHTIVVRADVITDPHSAAGQTAQIWNLNPESGGTNQPLLTIPVGSVDLAPSIFSPDGQSIVVVASSKAQGHESASLEIWSLRRSALEQRLSVDFQVHALAYSPDNKRVACGGRDGFSEAVSTSFKVMTFNLITGERDRIFPWNQRTVTDMAYDRDGRWLATASSGEVKVWDVTSPSDPTEVILASIPEHNVGPGDWPQWGGSRSRINTPRGKHIPIDWDVGVDIERASEPWDVRKARRARDAASRTGRVPDGSRNIKWAVPLGTQSYGNPVVANGRVFVGTNNGAGYLARYPETIDLGVLLCFEESTGKFLWQHSNEKLRTGRVHDWPQQGVCSTPVIDGNRLWYVTNRGEIVCLDAEGFRDGENDGLFASEKPDRPDVIWDEPHEADIVWKFDMMAELGVRPHNMSNCSMLIVDGLLFVCTSNGVDEGHLKLSAPDAPSFLAMDKTTGKIVWTDNSPGSNILHAQWASPSYGVFEGQPQVIFPGGDGWVYSFDPKGDGQGHAQLLWKFDANPKESIYLLGGRATRNSIIAFPAIYDGLVYIVVGEDPEHGEGRGHLWCIDPAHRIDGADISEELAVDANGEIVPQRRLQAVITRQGERAVPNPASGVRWHYSSEDRNGNGKVEFEEEFHRSLSIPVIKDDILYTADFSGLFHCLNAKTGKFYWNYDMFAACWGSALLVDGHVYICDEDGDVNIFRHSADPHIAMQAMQLPEISNVQFEPINARRHTVQDRAADGTLVNRDEFTYGTLGNSIYMTPIVANNVLYIATKNTLYAIHSVPAHPAPSLRSSETSE